MLHQIHYKHTRAHGIMGYVVLCDYRRLQQGWVLSLSGRGQRE